MFTYKFIVFYTEYDVNKCKIAANRMITYKTVNSQFF